MLLLNRTLLRMARGLWGWILAIAGLKLLTLVGTATFAGIVSGYLGNLTSPQLTLADARHAILGALFTALWMLGTELLTGEAEYRCTAKARQSLRTSIFSKILELDVGNIEVIGPSSAITSAVDGVESMQVYYSKYLPGLIYWPYRPSLSVFPVEGDLLSPGCAVAGRFGGADAGKQPFPPAHRVSENGILEKPGTTHWLLSGKCPGSDHPQTL